MKAISNPVAFFSLCLLLVLSTQSINAETYQTELGLSGLYRDLGNNTLGPGSESFFSQGQWSIIHYLDAVDEKGPLSEYDFFSRANRIRVQLAASQYDLPAAHVDYASGGAGGRYFFNESFAVDASIDYNDAYAINYAATTSRLALYFFKDKLNGLSFNFSQGFGDSEISRAGIQAKTIISNGSSLISLNSAVGQNDNDANGAQWNDFSVGGKFHPNKQLYFGLALNSANGDIQDFYAAELSNGWFFNELNQIETVLNFQDNDISDDVSSILLKYTHRF